ncbi:hypothetical protein D3C80_2147550 [compost metagenome]
MGRIGDKLRLTLELHTQAFGEMVQGTHQWPQLALHLHQRQRSQVIGLALLHRRAQALQRTQRGTDGEPHQQQRAPRQHPQT